MTQATVLHHYGIFLVPGFSSLAVHLVTEPLFIANWLAEKQLFDWTTLSLDGLAVRSSSGIMTAVDAPISGDDTGLFDTVFVVASFDARTFAREPRLKDWLRKCKRNGVRIGAIETGCEVLMDAGLIQTGSVPIHWYNAKGSAERHPDIQITKTLFETAGQHPLSAGGMGTAEMMLDLVAQTAGDALASEVGKHLLLEGRRPASRPQPSTGKDLSSEIDVSHHTDPVMHAHAIMEKNLEDPMSCVELAAQVKVSTRHLQRLFCARLGRGIEATYRELRLAKAHQLVQQTDISLTEVGIACGFSSIEVFSRTYSKRFGIAPSRDRRQSLCSTVYHRIPPSNY